MADIPESTNPVRIALEDVTPVIAAAFANDTCLIWSGEWQAYWRDGGHGYTKAADQAGLYTIEAAYARTRHCDPTKQIAFERIDATRAAPPAMDREAVEDAAREAAYHAIHGPNGDPFQDPEGYDYASKVADAVLSTLSADAIRQGEGATTANFAGVPDGWKMVPILPTDEMLHAGGGMIPGSEVDPTAAGIVWCFMLDAAPRPATPASHASDGGKA